MSTAADGSSVPLALFFTREGLVGATVEGEVQFKHPWRSRQHASVNAASPLVVSNEVFLTASYDTGGALLRLKDRGVKVIWSSDEALSAHYATPVVRRISTGSTGVRNKGPDFQAASNGPRVKCAGARAIWARASWCSPATDWCLLEPVNCRLLRQAHRRFSIGRTQVLGRDTRALRATEGVLVAILGNWFA
jgi:hypothetical protein